MYLGRSDSLLTIQRSRMPQAIKITGKKKNFSLAITLIFSYKFHHEPP